METLLGGSALVRCPCFAAPYSSSYHAVFPHSSPFSCSAVQDRATVGNQQQEEEGGASGWTSEQEEEGASGWTSEQLDIVSALLQRRPRQFSANRPAPPAPRCPSTHRSLGLPPVRYVRTHIISLPRPAKDKLFLTRLAAQISELPHGHHASHILHSCQHVLIRGSLSATIRELGHLGLPLRALETFEWQQQCTHLWPDERTLCASIQVLAEAQMEDKAWELLRTHAPTTPLAFQALTHGLTVAGLLHSALLAKKEAEKCGCFLSQGEYAELVLLASRQNRMEDVRMLVQELGTFPELQLSLEHCTSIMAACRKACMYDAVLGLFQWWKHAGFLPNVVMYEIVITSLSSLGKHRDALAIYWDMEKNGCAPNLVAYTALFEVCTQLGDTSRALKLYSKMRDSNIAPTRPIYTNLIKLCCRDGRLGKAREFMEAMRKEGLPVGSLDIYARQ